MDCSLKAFLVSMLLQHEQGLEERNATGPLLWACVLRRMPTMIQLVPDLIETISNAWNDWIFTTRTNHQALEEATSADHLRIVNMKEQLE